jgi:hypothetical protein
MIFVLLFVIWTSTGDVQTASKAFTTQDDCEKAATAIMDNLDAHKDEATKAGIEAAITHCQAVSNPLTEQKA